MALLEIRGVSKLFGARKIVSDLTLSLDGGKIFGFLGPNGAGKTTTIRMITGILKPSRGAITIDGYDITKDPIAAKLRTGYIPDAPYLYPKLTGWEYLALIADLYRVDGFETRGESLLQRFDLWTRRNDFIESYSFGMRQKLSIASAVLSTPKLIVVDEPLIGLDPPAARSVKDLFVEEASRGAAVFMSTHLLEIAEALCDSVAIIDGGELVAQGTLDELLAKKRGRLEAVFLSMLAERREEGTAERERWDALARAASRDGGASGTYD